MVIDFHLKRFASIAMLSIKALIFMLDASNSTGQRSKVQLRLFLDKLSETDPNTLHDQSFRLPTVRHMRRYAKKRLASIRGPSDRPACPSAISMWAIPATIQDCTFCMWTDHEPMLREADRFGVSSSYLALVFTELRIPRPAPGHWTQLEVGKAPPKPDLPPPRPGDLTEWSPGTSIGSAVRTIAKAVRTTEDDRKPLLLANSGNLAQAYPQSEPFIFSGGSKVSSRSKSHITFVRRNGYVDTTTTAPSRRHIRQ